MECSVEFMHWINISTVSVKTGGECMRIAFVSGFNKLRKGVNKFTQVLDNHNLSCYDIFDDCFGSRLDVFGYLLNLWSLSFLHEPLFPGLIVLLNLSPVISNRELAIMGVRLINFDSEVSWSRSLVLVIAEFLVFIPIELCFRETFKFLLVVFDLRAMTIRPLNVIHIDVTPLLSVPATHFEAQPSPVHHLSGCLFISCWTRCSTSILHNFFIKF